jgi:hypothetical protein
VIDRDTVALVRRLTEALGSLIAGELHDPAAGITRWRELRDLHAEAKKWLDWPAGASAGSARIKARG